MKRLLIATMMAAGACLAAAEPAKENRYVDPNAYAGYEAAMAPKPGDQMAVEWQNAGEDAIRRATAPCVLDSHVADGAAALSLLRCAKGAYATHPLVLAVIAATTQHTMRPGAAECQRDVWSEALLAHAGSSGDPYVQMLCLDQLRWCGRSSQAAAVLSVGERSKDRAVRDFSAMVARELEK